MLNLPAPCGTPGRTLGPPARRSWQRSSSRRISPGRWHTAAAHSRAPAACQPQKEARRKHWCGTSLYTCVAQRDEERGAPKHGMIIITMHHPPVGAKRTPKVPSEGAQNACNSMQQAASAAPAMRAWRKVSESKGGWSTGAGSSRLQPGRVRRRLALLLGGAHHNGEWVHCAREGVRRSVGWMCRTVAMTLRRLNASPQLPRPTTRQYIVVGASSYIKMQPRCATSSGRRHVYT